MISEEVKKVMSEMGKRGGEATMKKHGAEHYKKLAANMNKKLGRTGKKKTQPLKKNPLNMTFE